jgi:hypothetical protein
MKQEKESKDQQAGTAPVAVAPAPKKKTAEEAGKPAMLTAELVSKAQDIKEQELEIEEWGGTVIVRGLSSIDHERLTSSCTEGPIGERQFNMVGYQPKVAILCSYDGFAKDGGKRIFGKEHLAMLMEKASGPVAAVATLAHELSGIGKDAVKKAQENLKKIPSADSLFD